MEHLTNLQELWLSNNRIDELKGLDTLVNLRELYLSWNKIEEIKGLEHLKNLVLLRLYGNPLRSDERHVVFQIPAEDILEGTTDYVMNLYSKVVPVEESWSTDYTKDDAQEIVRYCIAKKEDKVPFVTIGETRQQEIIKYCQEKAKRND